MSSASTSSGRPSGKTTAAIILAVIAILFLILGFYYLAVPAKSEIGIIGYIKHSTGHHALRQATAFVIGIVGLIAAWFVKKSDRMDAAADASEPSQPATRE